MGRLLCFLTHGAPVARFARESSAIKNELKLSCHLPIVCFENFEVMRGEFNGLFIMKQIKKP